MAESQNYRMPPSQPVPPPRNKPRRGCLFFFLIFFAAAALGLVLMLFMSLIVAGAKGSGLASLAGDSIAMVQVNGIILDAEDVVDQIRKYARNDHVRGILVRIDSPGGTVGASQEIYSAILNARQVKPVYASMGNTAASGGYYIAAAANRIYANPGTVTGSIGVIFELTNFQELVDKVGLNFEVVKSGPYKDIGSPTRPLEPRERIIMQGLIDDTYEQFVEAILSQRREPLAAAQAEAATSTDDFWPGILLDGPVLPRNAEELLRRIADGRLYSGRQALRLGLVDAVGSEGDCIMALGEAVGLEDPHIIEEQPMPTILQLLLGKSADAVAQKIRHGANLSYRVAY